MKKLLYVFLLSPFLFSSVCYSQSISLTSLSSYSLCAGVTNFSVAYTTTGTFTNNQINVELSDKGGSFTNSQIIGSGTSSPIAATIPSNLPSGINYKVRLASISPVVRSNESSVITFSKISYLNIYNTQNDNITYNELNIMCTGRKLTITTALTDTSGMTFQWRKDGVNIIQAATYSKYKLSSQGRYAVSATQGTCPVINSPQGPYVYYYDSINWTTSVGVSGSATQCAGNSVSLFAAAYTDSVRYQWYRDNQVISGATNRNYTASQSGVYRYIGTDGGCVYDGTTGRFSIINTPVSVTLLDTLNRTNTAICTGGGLKLFATALGGDAPMQTYAWQKNNIAISGATANNYTATQSGTYKVTVTQTGCSSVNSSYILNYANTIPTPTLNALDTIRCSGQTSLINSNSNYVSNTLTYQWKRNNVNIVGANVRSYTANTTGNYSFSIIDNACNANSNPVGVRIGGVQQSLKTSNWTDITTWSCGNVPVLTDEVIINSGHLVTIPNNYASTIKKLIFKGGILSYGLNSSIGF
jgi:trimeric autotransporter adhesin